MRFVFLAIVLGFPILDVFATLRFARWTGTPVWVWLGAASIAGFFLLRNERPVFRAKTIAALRGDTPMLSGLVDSGRRVLAGLLFLLPGVLSDLLGLLLLALPLNLGRRAQTQAVAAGGYVIESSARRLD